MVRRSQRINRRASQGNPAIPRFLRSHVEGLGRLELAVRNKALKRRMKILEAKVNRLERKTSPKRERRISRLQSQVAKLGKTVRAGSHSFTEGATREL